MGSPRLTLDTAQLHRSVRECARRIKAVRQSVEKPVAGEVLVSRRTKLAGERGRAAHGKLIANAFASIGRDPFAYPPSVADRARRGMSDAMRRAIDQAMATGRAQTSYLKARLGAVAMGLALWARQHLLSGGLGQVAVSTAKAKARLAAIGVIPGRNIRTYGVRSGRFADGIRARGTTRRGSPP